MTRIVNTKCVVCGKFLSVSTCLSGIGITVKKINGKRILSHDKCTQKVDKNE